MKQMNRIAMVAGVLLLGAAAQDGAGLDKMNANIAKMKAELDATLSNVVVLNAQGVMGKQVKGAPYSAEEVRETTQVLADGTRIHTQETTTVYRDGEGRIRRETPEQINIFDPVGGVSYSLNPKNQTGRKTSVNISYTIKTAGRGAVTANDEVGAASQKIGIAVFNSDKLASEDQAASFRTGFEYGQKQIAAGRGGRGGAGEDLGTQTIEGVTAQGARSTRTIEANTIGNDRPIQIVSETWTSPDLQIPVMTKHTDPRTGEELFRVTNIRRGEPGIGLFQPPSNYQIAEPKLSPMQTAQPGVVVRKEIQ